MTLRAGGLDRRLPHSGFADADVALDQDARRSVPRVDDGVDTVSSRSRPVG
jgi:hypothetical protein